MFFTIISAVVEVMVFTGVAKVYYDEYKSGHRKRCISKAMEVGLILLLSFTLFGYIVDAKFGYMFV